MIRAALMGLFSAAVLTVTTSAIAGEKVESGKWKGWTRLFHTKADPSDPQCAYLFGDPKNNKWVLEDDGVLHNDLSQGDHHGTDIATKELFTDFELHVEFMIPKGSNSGVYLRGNIEIQIQDNSGKEKPGAHDMGAIYSKKPPLVNVCGKPDTWQTYDFKVAGDKLTAKLNGTVIHDNATLSNTPGQFPALPYFKGKYKEANAAGPGPLMIQGNHGEIRLRNVYIKPIE